MIHSLFDTQDQNTDFSNFPKIDFPKDSLADMKKGVMINGSEVFYGNGRTSDNNTKIVRRRIQKTTITREYKYTKKVKKSSQGGQYKQITSGNNKNGNSSTLNNSKCLLENKEIEFACDESKPTCFISIRLYKGDIIKAKFNCCQKFGDVYSLVKKHSRSNNFVLLEGFPPKPIKEYGKTISELGLENSMLTQRIN